MKIGIDIQALQTKSSRNRGIGRYIRSVVEALFSLKDEHIYSFYGSNLLSPINDTDYLPKCTYLKFLAQGSIGFNKSVMQEAFTSGDIDALLLSSPMELEEALIPNHQKLSKPLFTICYDLIPLVFADKYLTDKNQRDVYMHQLVNFQNADFTFAISEATRQDAIKHLGISPDKIINVSSGVSPFFTPIATKSIQSWLSSFSNKFGINKQFILYTGGEDWRKNIEGLVKAFAHLPESVKKQYQLVVACKVSDNFIINIKDLANKFNISQSVILTNYVTDEELRALYSTCSLFVFPSYYEGFGLPLLEAISCGAPAVASNSSSLTEIVSDPNLLFDPHSTEDIAQCMHKVLTNENLRKKLSENTLSHASQFTWESVAQKMSDVFSEYQAVGKTTISFIADEEKKSKPEIAFFSPFRPLQSGISDYSYDLLPFLSNHFDLDLYNDLDYSPDNEPNYQQLPHSKFEENANFKEYKTIIYQVGNSSYHCYMYSQLMRYPGISVLHDYHLAGMVNYMEHHRPEFGLTLYQELRHSYGSNKALDISIKLDNNELQFEKISELGIHVNRRIFTRSLGVIVHSKSTYNAAIKDFGRDNEFITHIPLVVPPFYSDKNHINIRQEFNISANAFVVSVFGIIAGTKRPLPILNAFQKYSHNNPNAYLLFVGSPELMAENVLENEINKLGLEGKVKITGYVAMADFYRYIQISDLCLNLRFPSHGESSASLLRILSAGKPTIVTDIGSFSDFPDDVVLKITQPNQCDEVEEICKALTLLTDNQDYRDSLSSNALAYITREHYPERCARLYAEFVQQVCSSPEAKSKLVARCNQPNIISLSSGQGNGNGGINRQKYLQLEEQKQWSENREQAWRSAAEKIQLELKALDSVLNSK